MRKSALPLGLLATALVSFLCAGPVHAQATKRTFVSAAGNDANVSATPPCNATAPCRTFGAAYTQTIPSGEINVLDIAGYGTLTITQPLTIQGHGWASITSQSGPAITVSASQNDKVTLRGLLLDGASTGSYGVLFNSGQSLTIQDSVIRNFGNHGIHFAPTTSSSLVVSSTVISENLEGIDIVPSPFLNVRAVIDRVQLINNTIDGLFVGQSNAAAQGSIQVTVTDSVIAGNADGIQCFTNSAQLIVCAVRNSTIANNSATGLSAGGANDILLLSGSMVTGNGTGWSGASVFSYGDNEIDYNGSANTAPTFTTKR